MSTQLSVPERESMDLLVQGGKQGIALALFAVELLFLTQSTFTTNLLLSKDHPHPITLQLNRSLSLINHSFANKSLLPKTMLSPRTTMITFDIQPV